MWSSRFVLVQNAIFDKVISQPFVQTRLLIGELAHLNDVLFVLGNPPTSYPNSFFYNFSLCPYFMHDVLFWPSDPPSKVSKYLSTYLLNWILCAQWLYLIWYFFKSIIAKLFLLKIGTMSRSIFLLLFLSGIVFCQRKPKTCIIGGACYEGNWLWFESPYINFASFQGIRYAKPPIINLRYKIWKLK